MSISIFLLLQPDTVQSSLLLSGHGMEESLPAKVLSSILVFVGILRFNPRSSILLKEKSHQYLILNNKHKIVSHVYTKLQTAELYSVLFIPTYVTCMICINSNSSKLILVLQEFLSFVYKAGTQIQIIKIKHILMYQLPS